MSTNSENNSGKSPHILNASSNLVGFSFILLTAIKVIGPQKTTLVDDIAAVEILLFCVSSLFSFMSMRTASEYKAYLYESIADYIFFAGLSILSLAAVLLAFVLIK